MSITTETNRTTELTTDGAETDFDFSMLIQDDAELQVWYKPDSPAGTGYGILTLDTDYGVVFTEDGGTVSTTGYRAALAAGALLIVRHLDLTQETNWLYNDNHTGPQHQDDFDRSTMRDIQQQEELDRCLKFATHSSTENLTLPEPEADKVLGWDAEGTEIVNRSLTYTSIDWTETTYNFKTTGSVTCGEIKMSTMDLIGWFSSGVRKSYIQGSDSSLDLWLWAEDQLNLTAGDDIELVSVGQIRLKPDNDNTNYLQIQNSGSKVQITAKGSFDLELSSYSGDLIFASDVDSSKNWNTSGNISCDGDLAGDLGSYTLYVDSTAHRVGIGTDTPSYLLDVAGNAQVTGDITDGTTARTVTELSKGAAYLVVAANDATTAVKERADYLCDGTADNVQIQAAIDACVAINGGGVLLSAGSFYIAASIEPRGEVKLKGMGVYATDVLLAANCDMFVYDSVSQEGFFHLEDMCLNGQKASYSGSCFVTNDQLWDVYITRVFIHSFSGNGVYTEKCWGWKVINTFIEWCGGVGFYLASGDGPYLSGCKFRQNNKDALRVSLGSSTQAIGCEFKALSGRAADGNNSATFYVQVDCAEADIATVQGWEVGDVVQNNNDGGGIPGDDWTGVLNEVAYLADDTRLIITMDGGFDDTDVDLADGIDNTTKTEQASLDGKEAHRYAGVRIEAGAHDCKIIGCIFDMVSGHNCIGVFVASSRNTIIGNKFTYGHTGVFIPGGTNPVGGSYMGQYCSVIGNTFVGQSAEAVDIDKVSKNNIYGNEGYISQTMEKLSVEGDGAATTIVVTHKLNDNKPAGSIRCYQITPASAKMAAATYYISAEGATTFTITFSAALEDGETYSFYALADFQRYDWDMTAVAA